MRPLYNAANSRYLTLLLLLVTALLAITMLSAPMLSGGVMWDAANTLGFIAFAGMLYLFVDVGRGERNRFHQIVSYGAAAALAAHVGWLLAADRTIWHYLSPDAPPYMLTGLIALLLLSTIIVLALPRWRRIWQQRFRNFQRWHYWLSVCAIMMGGYHIWGSSFYISGFIETAAFLALSGTVVLVHRLGRHYPRSTTATLWAVPAIGVVFVLLKWSMA